MHGVYACFQGALASSIQQESGPYDEEAVTRLVLLSLLRQMTQLQHLQVSKMQLDELTDLQQLSALTASPQLTSLAVLARWHTPIPLHGLQHMLPQDRQLSQLRVLRLQGSEAKSDQQCLDSGDIQRIAEACPGLTELTLKGVVSVGASLQPLVAHLQQSLVSLTVAGPAFDDAAAAVVAQLQHLQRLEWSDSPELSDDGLSQLAVLSKLVWLSIRSCKGLSHIILPPDTWYAASKLELETPEVSISAHQQKLWRLTALGRAYATAGVLHVTVGVPQITVYG
jgi:hypothetical protein